MVRLQVTQGAELRSAFVAAVAATVVAVIIVTMVAMEVIVQVYEFR